MAFGSKPSQTIADCKLKAVNPPFRSVSTPRGRKDLRVVGRVNPGSATRPASVTDWSAKRLSERLRIELSPRALTRLVRAASRHGASVEQLLRSALSDFA
jgi:hypothetical protein